MGSIDYTVRRFVGGSLIALGLVLNKWSLEVTVVADGRIDSVAIILLVLLVQLLLMSLGILFWLGSYAWVTNLALALLSLAITLLVFEGLFRALGIQAEYHAPRREELLRAPGGPSKPLPHAHIPMATRRLYYSSNPRGYFDPGNVINHVHNSAGWRDVERSTKKAPRTFRILGLGDSYLYGTGVRYEDIVLTKLGAFLEDDIPGVPIETINTGVPGMNTVGQRALLRDRGMRYDPDLIILFYVLNDVGECLTGCEGVGPRSGKGLEFFGNYTSLYQDEDWLSAHSNLWGWGRQRVLQSYLARRYLNQIVSEFAEDKTGWKQSRDALDGIRRLAADHGVPLLVVIFPFFHDLDGDYPFQIVHDLVRDYCESVGIPVIDLRRSYSEYHGPELWVHPRDQHPNEVAHEIAARRIEAYLKTTPRLIGG
jgi:hypothetical protein